MTRLLSVPVPVIDDYPQSPAERYITIRSCMLYDANGQPSNVSRSPEISQAPSTVSQTIRNTGNTSQQTKTIVKMTNLRPQYQRQESQHSTSPVANNISTTPIFQPIPDSNQSTADYPLMNESTIATTSSTLRIQMSHAQHMQAWRQNQLRKIYRKRPYRYVYGSPARRTPEEKLATAAILIPQVASSHEQTKSGRRIPSSSPFQYPSASNDQQLSSGDGVTRRNKPIEKKSIRSTITSKNNVVHHTDASMGDHSNSNSRSSFTEV
jgi:hypothetical protein